MFTCFHSVLVGILCMVLEFKPKGFLRDGQTDREWCLWWVDPSWQVSLHHLKHSTKQAAVKRILRQTQYSAFQKMFFPKQPQTEVISVHGQLFGLIHWGHFLLRTRCILVTFFSSSLKISVCESIHSDRQMRSLTLQNRNKVDTEVVRGLCKTELKKIWLVLVPDLSICLFTEELQRSRIMLICRHVLTKSSSFFQESRCVGYLLYS